MRWPLRDARPLESDPSYENRSCRGARLAPHRPRDTAALLASAAFRMLPGDTASPSGACAPATSRRRSLPPGLHIPANPTANALLRTLCDTSTDFPLYARMPG